LIIIRRGDWLIIIIIRRGDWLLTCIKLLLLSLHPCLQERSESSKTELCTNFALGRCTYGASCRFSHDTAAYLASKQPDLPGSCPFTLQDACPYGAQRSAASAAHTRGSTAGIVMNLAYGIAIRPLAMPHLVIVHMRLAVFSAHYVAFSFSCNQARCIPPVLHVDCAIGTEVCVSVSVTAWPNTCCSLSAQVEYGHSSSSKSSLHVAACVQPGDNTHFYMSSALLKLLAVPVLVCPCCRRDLQVGWHAQAAAAATAAA
jgi:hypothetical protein